jgi:hypothetical protein
VRIRHGAAAVFGLNRLLATSQVAPLNFQRVREGIISCQRWELPSLETVSQKTCLSLVRG